MECGDTSLSVYLSCLHSSRSTYTRKTHPFFWAKKKKMNKKKNTSKEEWRLHRPWQRRSKEERGKNICKTDDSGIFQKIDCLDEEGEKNHRRVVRCALVCVRLWKTRSLFSRCKQHYGHVQRTANQFYSNRPTKPMDANSKKFFFIFYFTNFSISSSCCVALLAYFV